MYKDEPKRTRAQSLAHASSITILIIAFLIVFSGIIIELLQGLAGGESEGGESVDILVSMPVFNLETLTYTLMVVSAIFTGLLGIRAAYYPKRYKAFFVASIVSICIAVPSAAFGFSIDLSYFIVNIIFLAAPIFCVWTSYKLKQEALEYEQAGREFIEPLRSKRYLGFLRFIEFAFIVNVLLTLIGLIFTSRNAVAYTPAQLIDWLNVVFECVALWFIMRRFRATRLFVIIFALFNITAGWTVDLIVGNFDLLPNIFASLSDIILILYFSTSRRVRLICVAPFMLREDASQAQSGEKTSRSNGADGRLSAGSSSSIAFSRFWDTGWKRACAS